jgi:hypothetical protein
VNVYLRRLLGIVMFFCASCVAMPTSAFAQSSPLTMHDFAYLIGNWQCTSNAGGKNQSYRTTWSYALGNTWIRSSESSASETLITHLNSKSSIWQLVHMSSDGVMVFQGPGNDAQHLALHATLPTQSLDVRFDRVSDSFYTLTFSGDLSGHDRCMKRT